MIETDRLVLRNWRDNDRAPFHAISRDPAVMATLGPLMSRKESDAVIDRLIGDQARFGFCFWAMTDRGDGALLGFCGLRRASDDTPVAGEIEAGWRLASTYWGRGLAREAAEACLAWAWANTLDAGLTAYTAAVNERSWRLMERLGMTRDRAADFDHPRVPDGSVLKPHIVYRIDRR